MVKHMTHAKIRQNAPLFAVASLLSAVALLVSLAWLGFLKSRPLDQQLAASRDLLGKVASLFGESAAGLLLPYPALLVSVSIGVLLLTPLVVLMYGTLVRAEGQGLGIRARLRRFGRHLGLFSAALALPYL